MMRATIDVFLLTIHLSESRVLLTYANVSITGDVYNQNRNRNIFGEFRFFLRGCERRP